MKQIAILSRQIPLYPGMSYIVTVNHLVGGSSPSRKPYVSRPCSDARPFYCSFICVGYRYDYDFVIAPNQ